MIKSRMVAARRGLVAAVGIAGAVLTIGAPASAHVGVDADEMAAGSATALSFGFSHGCGESPTSSLRFQMPVGVNRAVPHAHAGWDVTVETETLPEPIEGAHGQVITERPAVIEFTARDGFEVPNGVRDAVTITVTAPEEEGLVHFKVVQGCVEGSSGWIEEWDGTGAEPDNPAPSVMVVAATGTHGDGADASDAAAPSDTAAPAATVAIDGDASDAGDSAGSTNGVAIAGVVLGAVGVGVGTTALVTSRRKS